MNLIPTDVERHEEDTSVKLLDTDFGRGVRQVLGTLTPIAVQVRATGGHWYRMRIYPCRTSDNFIDGVVMAFTNTDAVKSLEARPDHSALHSEALLRSILTPPLVFGDDLRVVTANRALHTLLRAFPSRSGGSGCTTSAAVSSASGSCASSGAAGSGRIHRCHSSSSI
ncbi:PAS domain-containing protein [Deinococcus hopiensis]|uniref:PAS domain-containing protein n=1 Tax=Deinococcus hopiensis TaxID=309885 RepID=UPI0009FD335A|nr:PAS domain-containing protein [Deinococcus hopiensis]